MTALIILSLAIPALTVTSSMSYTLNKDFDQGTLVGLEHNTVPDQLQLSNVTTTFPFMWIANSGEDTISKWNTDTNKEVARYNTWFGLPADHDSWTGPAPSRTAIDSQGNCYVANRHFDDKPTDVMKILLNDYIDRNHDGKLNTSYDKNGDGNITPDEMLPMNDTNKNGIIDDNEIKDERVAWVVQVGADNGWGRSLSIDKDGNLWVGLYSTHQYYELSSVNGSIIAGPIDVSDNTPDGSFVDKHGILWGTSEDGGGLNPTLLKLNTTTKAVKVYHLPDKSLIDYGIGLAYDANDSTIVYLGDSSGQSFIKFDSSTETFSTPAKKKFPATGGINRFGWEYSCLR